MVITVLIVQKQLMSSYIICFFACWLHKLRSVIIFEVSNTRGVIKLVPSDLKKKLLFRSF
jgi:hypothetical protein